MRRLLNVSLGANTLLVRYVAATNPAPAAFHFQRASWYTYYQGMCGGWDSNPRTPEGRGPEPRAVDQAGRPPRSLAEPVP